MSEKKDNVIDFSSRVTDNILKNLQKSKMPTELQLQNHKPELEPTMTIKEREAVLQNLKRFYTGNDLGFISRGFSGFRECGSYDFNNIPIREDDDYFLALEPKFYSNLLQHVCSTKGDGDKMYHSAFMSINYDVFCVKNPGNEGPEYETFFNPQLISVSDESEKAEEHSAFYPGAVFEIERPKACIVAYLDYRGEKCLEELHDDWCRYFLQGFEVSRGKRIWENVSDLKRQRVKKQRKKLLGANWSGLWI